MYLGIALLVFIAYRVGKRRGYDKHHADRIVVEQWATRLNKLTKEEQIDNDY